MTAVPAGWGGITPKVRARMEARAEQREMMAERTKRLEAEAEMMQLHRLWHEAVRQVRTTAFAARIDGDRVSIDRAQWEALLSWFGGLPE